MYLSEMNQSKFFSLFCTSQFVKPVSYHAMQITNCPNNKLSKYRCIFVLVLYALREHFLTQLYKRSFQNQRTVDTTVHT